MTKSLKDFQLRANPEYELVLFDRLSDSQQQMLEGLKGDPDCYGILRPRTAGNLSIKAASRDAALLFFTLQNPGPLPRYVEQTLGDQCDCTIAQMVLDGILEIEAGGAMLSGPAAHSYICDDSTQPEKENFLAALSRRALQYAETLDLPDASTLSMRLYNYNRVPASPRWWRIDQGPNKTPWLAWQSHRRRPDQSHSAAAYKLYVSPACSALREAFQAVLAVADSSAAYHFKVGSDVYGLLLPDKIVLYFNHFAELRETAEQLMQRLSNCPVHGVPFTAELDGGGLLSWGVDPPAEKQTVPWLEQQSWRLWIANRLATALLVARN